jgi:hypothetical protein
LCFLVLFCERRNLLVLTILRRCSLPLDPCIYQVMPLHASMNTRPILYPPICAFNTIGTCPGLGTFLGWSTLLNLIGWSDHLKYSIVVGGDDLAKFTYLDILFCSILDFGNGWIIADMYTFDSGCLVIPCI